MRALLFLPLAATAQAAGTIQLAWTTDMRPSGTQDKSTIFGPDGPWQAIYVNVGNDGRSISPMWPTGGGTTMVLTRRAGGTYEASSSAIPTNVSMSNSDEWMSSIVLEDDPTGFGFIDSITIPAKSTGASPLANISLVAESRWPVPYADDLTYTAPVGILGLGPSRPSGSSSSSSSLPAPAGFIPDLKSRGEIASRFFGLHMGSVAFQQRGSLVLGGYERNRALGPVGVFRNDMDVAPYLILRDVLLGTHLGRAPFSPSIKNKRGSIWRGVGDNLTAKEILSTLGGKEGSAVAMVNPAVPYIYLPPGTCEAAAAHLPVTFSPKLNLYLWNTASPAYEPIINSPSYLGFVFADRTATNITIKVPFHLLNLTLEAPLVDKPTPYFPCRDFNSSWGFWMLGRAFLQAAFLGVDYERNLTYLAQAPGPEMEQSVVMEKPPGFESVETNPIEEWETSWIKRWTVLEEVDAGGSPIEEGKQGGQSMGAGAIAGMVVGILLLLVAVAAGVWYWRKRAGRGKPVELAQGEPREEWAKGYQGFAEADGRDRPIEVPAKMMVHEMEAPTVTHEAPGHLSPFADPVRVQGRG